MLVLSRKPGERIVFPGLGVVLTVVGASAGRVRIGIEAPPEVPVHREEIWQRLRRFQVRGGTEAGRRPVPSEGA